MKHLNTLLHGALMMGAAAVGSLAAAPLGTAFNYQGRLEQNGLPAPSGIYQMTFALFADALSGNLIASNNLPSVPVTNGLFNTTLDFGPSAFVGEERWLQLHVRTNNPALPLVPLSPRIRLAPTPHSIFASTAGTAANVTNGAVSAAGLATMGAPAAGQLLAYNGAQLVWQSPAVAGAWTTSGNMVEAGSFFGTVNNAPLELRANNARTLRLEPTTTTPNVIGGFAGNYAGPGVEGAYIGGGGAATLGGATATNRVLDLFSTIAGGASNTVGTVGPIGDVAYGSIGGGYGNTAGGHAAHVGGGAYNRAMGSSGTTVGGGWNNLASGDACTIAGGSTSRATNGATFVGGGYGNLAGGNSAAVVGGRQNQALGFAAAIGGGENNQVGADHATIGGGGTNLIQGFGSVIAGGANNRILNYDATVVSSGCAIGGGFNNVIGAYYVGEFQIYAGASVVAGGLANAAVGEGAAVCGGISNRASAWSSGSATVGGGRQNEALFGGTVSGGSNNRASDMAVVPGGMNNQANGYASFAAGRNARALHFGAFVWSDGSVVFQSVRDNSFNALASGGFEFYTGGGAGARLPGGSGSWSSFSDRNAKANVEPVDTTEVLNKVAALNIARWNYKTQPAAVRHLGPMAQDFYAAFGLGETNTSIANVDADGVALAAIQGLNRKLEAELQARDARIAALEHQVTSLLASTAAARPATAGPAAAAPAREPAPDFTIARPHSPEPQAP